MIKHQYSNHNYCKLLYEQANHKSHLLVIAVVDSKLFSQRKQQQLLQILLLINANRSFSLHLHGKNTHSCLLRRVWPQGSQSSQLSAASFLYVAETVEHCSITSCAFKHHLSFYYLQIASVPLQGHSRPRRVLGIPPMGLLLLNSLNGSIHLRPCLFAFLYLFIYLFIYFNQKTKFVH